MIIFFIHRIYYCFFVFYPIRRIHIWSTTILDLFYDTFKTINEHNQRQNVYLSLIPNYFDIYFWINQKVFYNIICFIINHDFYVITSWMHYKFFIIIYRIAFVSSIFQVSDFLRLFMMSFKNRRNFKNRLILLSYSSTDSVLFPSPLLYIQSNSI